MTLLKISDILSSQLVKDFRLLFYEITGLSTSFCFRDWKKGRIDHTPKGSRPRFCRVMQECPEGKEMCVADDESVLDSLRMNESPVSWQCYAGLSSVKAPLYINGEFIGAIFAGDALMRRPSVQGFNHVRRRLNGLGVNVDMSALESAYYELPVLSPRKMKIALELLSLMIQYIIDREQIYLLQEAIYVKQQELIGAARERLELETDLKQRADDIADLRKHMLLLVGIGDDSATLSESDVRYHRVVQRALGFIDENFAGHITLTEVAERLRLSPNYVSRLFVEECGCTFSQYLLEKRVAGACKLLADPTVNISEACFDAGFQDASHFSRAFKKVMGMSPSQYRNKISLASEEVRSGLPNTECQFDRRPPAGLARVKMNGSDTKGYQGKQNAVTVRAVIMGSILGVANVYWVLSIEVFRGGGRVTMLSLFYTAVFSLLVLHALNLLCAKFRPSIALSRGEVLVVYILTSLATVMAGGGNVQILQNQMMSPHWFATPENRWGSLLLPRLSDLWYVNNREVAISFYRGGESLFDMHNLRALAVPAAMWLVFISVLAYVLINMTVVLREQWVQNEKLSYPLARIPLAITDTQTPLFRNRILWAGILIAVFIDLLAGLNALNSDIPFINTKGMNLLSVLTTPPWNAVGYLQVSFQPIIIGIAGLMPVDLLFSSWAFFVISKLVLVLAAAFGVEAVIPVQAHQSAGAYIVIVLLSLYAGKRVFARIFRNTFSVSGKMDETSAGQRSATRRVLVGVLALIAMAMSMGMAWWVAAVVVLVYLLISAGITRVRAEQGSPVNDLLFAGPGMLLVSGLGSANLGVSSLAGVATMYWIGSYYSPHAMPFGLEAFKMMRESSSNPKRLHSAMIYAVILGAVASLVLLFQHSFSVGAAKNFYAPLEGRTPWVLLDSWLRTPSPFQPSGFLGIAVGAVVTVVLQFLRLRLPWWPLHPAGYAIAGSYGMMFCWMPFFIAWLIKIVVLRYGGMRLYSALLPAFLGLIIGECVMGSLWSLVGLFTGLPTYTIYP